MPDWKPEIQARLAGATDAQLRRIADLPAGLTDVDARGGRAGGQAEPFWARNPAPAEERTAMDVTGQDVARAHGLRLGGLTLLLPAQPSDEDIEAIAAAARPLLHLLTTRGLLTEGQG